jgi:hypothetical protein
MTSTSYEVPVPMVRYNCPLAACTWDYYAPSITGAVIRSDEDIRSGMLAAAIANDSVIKAHLETHSLLEWVTEIARLREAIDLAAICLSDSGQVGAFVRAAVAPGSPIAAARAECLERLSR